MSPEMRKSPDSKRASLGACRLKAKVGEALDLLYPPLRHTGPNLD